MADPDSLSFFADLHGPALDPQPMPDPGALASRVPAELVAFWRRHPLGLYAGGLLHLCDPRRYDGLLPILLGADAELHPQDLAIYAFTAFGELFAWHRRLGGVEINLLTGDVAIAAYGKPKTVDPALDLEARLVTFDPELYDRKDEAGRPLFAAAVRALGMPALDQCFGFVPALALGGAARLEQLQRLGALEHFAILAQAGGLELKDFTTMPARPIRPIG